MATGVYIRTKEHIEKIKNRLNSPEVLEKLRISHIGKTPWNKGIKGYKAPGAGFKKGHTPYNKGKKNKPTQGFQKGHGSFVTKEKNAEAGIKRSGKNHWNWKGGITSENRLLRIKAKWKIWRGEVFERDKYTCKECRAKGVYLEAHHIIPIRLDKNKVFDIKNGITLCRPCHLKTLWKESDFAEKYSALVVAQID